MPTWLGQLMCDGATPEEAVERVKAYEKLIRPPITPKQAGLRPTLYCNLPPVLKELDQVRERVGVRTSHISHRAERRAAHTGDGFQN